VITKKLFCTIAILLSFAVSSFGQNGETKKPHGILGYLDPATGVFHTLPVPDASDDAAPAAAVTTGKFVFSFTITIDSSIATSAKIGCSASAQLLDVSTANLIEEEAAVVASRSGSTATCTVTIPYSWTLASASSDKVTLSYVISAPVEASASAQYPQRLSSQTLTTISVPKNGATTNETITATI